MSTFQNKNTILEVRSIKKSFNDLRVIDDVSLTLRKNEFVSLLGLSGSGKTTVFNIIAGLLCPDEGEILINGINRTGQSGRVSYMYQKDLLLPWKNVIDNAALPLVIRGKSRRSARDAVRQYFKVFGLEGFEYRYPFQLSGGMRQRTALMRTYVSSGDIMLLDEPFGALDAITRSRMQEWLLGILDGLDTSVLFITHDIEEAILLSDRIYMLSDKPARVIKEIDVKLENPRDANLATTVQFNRIRRRITDLLYQAGGGLNGGI